MALVKVNQSAQVLFLKPSTDSSHPWVVLCYDPAMGAHRWVVWLADDDGNTVSGGYHATIDEAQADFDSRPQGTGQLERARRN